MSSPNDGAWLAVAFLVTVVVLGGGAFLALAAVGGA